MTNGIFMTGSNASRPSEWGEIPAELLELMDNDGSAYMTPEGRAALNRIALGEWYIVRLSPDLDDVLVNRRCRECNAIHSHVTVRCVPAPFNGLRQLTTMFQRSRSGDFTVRALTWRDIEVISAADANRLNDRIRDRRGVPPINQNPPRPGDLDAAAIDRRIQARAAKARAVIDRAYAR